MSFATELKQRDLKGQFPCSACPKIFCHSSSLSRHRMQAHFKSYTCTQCNQEIPPDETLRSHMLKFHQISQMFMCRCCNWAFPDKTSSQIHMQNMSKHGHPSDVAVLARSFIEGAPLDTETLRRIIESHEPSPDDDRDTDSPNSDKVSSASPSMVFNNNNKCTAPISNELAALNLNMLSSNDGNVIKGQSPVPSGSSIFPSSNYRMELIKERKASSMDFSQERMPPRIWFVENGSDFIRVELPKPFILSAETMNNVYGGDGWIEDTPEIGNTNSGRVIKIVGTAEEIQYQLQLISEDIKMNVDNSRTPLTDEELEFVIECFIVDEKQKNPGKQINETEIRARVREDEEKRKQFLNENWRGEVYTSEIYD